MPLKRSMLPILFGVMCVVGYGQTPNGPADNTRVNQRDRNAAEPTADQQKMNGPDTKLAASVRKSIMDDKTLSTYAHNVKVIVQNGVITLKGPVHSAEERRSVVAKAADAAGSPDKVHDELSVQP
ncbi:MAG TPA: BON domain-containing protein [Terriglobales bacterium]|nr:BON domain-containing protein [Terriglobales bacterium]